MDADLVAAGWRLRWVGRRPGYSVVDLVALVRHLVADESSAVWRALNPDSVPLTQRMAIDQLNILWLQTIIARQVGGDSKAEFSPVYRYPGDAWTGKDSSISVGELVPGGYRVMSPGQAMAWLADDLAAAA